MNITRLIKDIMIDKGIKITQLNDMLNEKNNTNYTPQNLGKRLNKDDIKFGDAEEILFVLGYKLEIVNIENNEICKINPNSEIITHTSEMRLNDTFQGGIIDWDKTISKEFGKQLEKMVAVKAKDYFDKVLSDEDIYNDFLTKVRNKIAHNVEEKE